MVHEVAAPIPPVEYPAPHARHALAFSMSEYVPGGQSMQLEVSPEALKNVPGWQRVHAVSPTSSVYDPVGHRVQLSMEYAPEVSE